METWIEAAAWRTEPASSGNIPNSEAIFKLHGLGRVSYFSPGLSARHNGADILALVEHLLHRLDGFSTRQSPLTSCNGAG